MNRKRLEKIEQKLGEGLQRWDHLQGDRRQRQCYRAYPGHKGYKGKPQTVDIDSDDWKL